MSHNHNPGLRLMSKNDFCRRYNVGHTKFYELLNSGGTARGEVRNKDPRR